MTPLLFAATWAIVAATGHVTYVTSAEVFVDVGARHGLLEGQTLSLLRREKKVGSCVVAVVTPDRAVCRGNKVVVGDSVLVADPAAAPVASPGATRRLRAAGLSADVVAARREKLMQTSIPSAPFTPSSRTFSSTTLLGLRQQAWWSSTTDGSLFARPSLHIASRAQIPLAVPLTASTHVAVYGDVLAPANQRFRPGESFEVYVWEASLAALEGPVVGSAGRFRLRHVPGSPLVDGGQLGMRFWHDRVEVGVYGGLSPEQSTAYSAVDRIVAGAYGGAQVDLGDVVMLLPRLSAGILTAPDGARQRAEMGGQVQAVWQGVGFVGGALRAGLDLAGKGGFDIDSSSVDVYLRPLSFWTLNANYRLYRAPTPDFDVNVVVPAAQESQHGNVGTFVEAVPGVMLGAQAGVGFNETSRRLRAWFGPELSLPSILGGFAGIEGGYRVEAGDWPGQSGWIGTRVSLASSSLQLRLMGSELQAVIENMREVGVLLLSETSFTPSLALSGRLSATQGLPALSGSYRAAPTLLFGDVFLTWRL